VEQPDLAWIRLEKAGLFLWKTLEKPGHYFFNHSIVQGNPGISYIE
jgi:hypothetical protein